MPRVTGTACKPHREQGQAGINGPLNIPGRPLERTGDSSPRWMVVDCRPGIAGDRSQNPAYRSTRSVQRAPRGVFCALETVFQIRSEKLKVFCAALSGLTVTHR